MENKVFMYERDRHKFQKLFPNAIFEEYIYLRYVRFSFEGKINKTEIQSICDKAEIKIFFE